MKPDPKTKKVKGAKRAEEDINPLSLRSTLYAGHKQLLKH